MKQGAAAKRAAAKSVREHTAALRRLQHGHVGVVKEQELAHAAALKRRQQQHGTALREQAARLATQWTAKVDEVARLAVSTESAAVAALQVASVNPQMLAANKQTAVEAAATEQLFAQAQARPTIGAPRQLHSTPSYRSCSSAPACACTNRGAHAKWRRAARELFVRELREMAGIVRGLQ